MVRESIPWFQHSAHIYNWAPFQAHLPFAVVGSTEEVKVGNKLVRARQYPWGVVQGECGTGASLTGALTQSLVLPAEAFNHHPAISLLTCLTASLCGAR